MKSYFKEITRYGKQYRSILGVNGRLSKKTFPRAVEAELYSVELHQRYARLKKAARRERAAA